MDSEYSVRPVGRTWWQVAKFVGNKWPETVYDVRAYSYVSRLDCNCPADDFRVVCRHVKIVQEYIRVGQPHMNAFWIDKTGEVNGCYANFTTQWKRELTRVGRDDRSTESMGDGGTGAERVPRAEQRPKRVPNDRSVPRRVRKAIRGRR